VFFYGTFGLYNHFKEVWKACFSILIELLLALICDIMLTHLYKFTTMLSTHHPVIKVKLYKWSNYIQRLPPYKEARDAEMKPNFFIILSPSHIGSTECPIRFLLCFKFILNSLQVKHEIVILNWFNV
jgi:hypothetical protein